MGKGKKGLLALAVSGVAAAVAYKVIKNKKNAKVAATFVSSFDENGNETFTSQTEYQGENEEVSKKPNSEAEITSEAEETAMPEDVFKEEDSDVSESETD